MDTSPFWSGQVNNRMALSGGFFCTVLLIYLEYPGSMRRGLLTKVMEIMKTLLKTIQLQLTFRLNLRFPTLPRAPGYLMHDTPEIDDAAYPGER